MESLHPARRATARAGEKIDRRADAEGNAFGAAELAKLARDQFLCRAADAEQQNVPVEIAAGAR